MPVWFYVALAFFLALIGCWWFARSETIRQFSNTAPAEDRWHEAPTPGLGGVPIYCALCLAAIIQWTSTPLSFAVLIVALPLLIVGTYDDLKPVSPKVKFLAQCVCAYGFLGFIVNLELINTPVSMTTLSHVVHYSICTLWVVGMINAINLLDNIDGLSAGVSLIACVTIAWFLTGYEEYIGIGTLFFMAAGSLAGFLVLNFNPAKLFMGDAGTLWIGFLVGVGSVIVLSTILNSDTVALSPALHYGYAWLITVTVCAVPVIDTAMVVQRYSPGIAVLVLIVFWLIVGAWVVWLTRVTSAPNGIARPRE